ncbi:leucine-rich repeat domain-containing protein [Wukongibacter baidiensis]|uniref:leucine-rich repeat domain-containing protein n=1 Tax=Wukongibacter baidiensis TaxID=1723361 RepID=UPI003D7F6877
MKKACCLVLVLILTFSLIIPVNAVQLDSKTDVPLDKVWIVKFDKALNEDTVNSENIFIEDSSGGKVDIFVNLNAGNAKEVFIVAKDTYEAGENYHINITQNVKSVSGKYLKYPVTMEFETIYINQPPIVVKEIDDQIAKEGEVITIDLSEVFSDPDGDSLTYAVTEGELYGDVFRYTVEDLDEPIHNITIGVTDGEEYAFETFNVIINKEVEFEESVIEDTIRDIINKPSESIYSKDLEGITELELINEEISSLEGLQYLIGLKDLNLASNEISDLTPLSSLINLESLDLRSNDIDDIDPLGNLVNLKKLEISHNQIDDITALKKLKNLKELYMSYNDIEDVSPLGNLENLEIVDPLHNPIEDFDPIKHLFD